MKTDRIFSVLVMIIVAVSASAGQTGNKASSDNVRNEIEAASKRFAETLGKGEAAKIAGMYAEGARLMPPNGPMIQEAKGIQDFWQGFIKTGAKLSLTTSHVEAQGNVAIEVGTYELVSPDNTRDVGKFVVVWRRYKKDWKLAIDIWNSSMPQAK